MNDNNNGDNNWIRIIVKRYRVVARLRNLRIQEKPGKCQIFIELLPST